ncbi:MAG: hypothetical protein LAO56_08650 [Acidobacteriia bacterium]|nr:hypothetical protein [Terriglobia bacterium]
MGNEVLKDRRPLTRFPCAVCGIETSQHASWFLVVENRWVDRLKILSWHPVLAAQKDMLTVCSRQHLKMLITHWLTQANLDFQAGGDPAVPITSKTQTDMELGPLALGRLVGELAVHRESCSCVWTGSPETLECILNALISGVEPRTPALNSSTFDVSPDYYREFAFQ